MNKVHFSSESSEWRTPPELFNKLNAIYNFDVDICAGGTNSLCREYFSKEDDALLQIWRTKGLRYYMNPPYGRRKKDSEGNIIQWGIGDFVRKAYKETLDSDGFCVALLPARTDTKWFHDYIYNKPKVRIEFLKGRLKFSDHKNGAPFPSMLVYFNT